VRFIGDAAARIAEDYLRILRFFRFHAAYGEGKPDAAALHACIEGRQGLQSLSRERVRMELLKLLVARRAAEAVHVMADAGLLVAILGGVPYLAPFDAMAAIEAVSGSMPDAIRRLGALAVLITEDADRLQERLRLSNAEHARLRSMADGWWRINAGMTAPAARALLYRLGPDFFADRVLLAWSRARDRSDDPQWPELLALPARWQPPSCPLTAADLIARGVAKGPALGAALRAAEAAWIAADFPADPAVVAAIADGAAARRP
jgi:poly(A) polymerase